MTEEEEEMIEEVTEETEVIETLQEEEDLKLKTNAITAKKLDTGMNLNMNVLIVELMFELSLKLTLS
jgi:hypothetical protein